MAGNGLKNTLGAVAATVVLSSGVQAQDIAQNPGKEHVKAMDANITKKQEVVTISLDKRNKLSYEIKPGHLSEKQALKKYEEILSNEDLMEDYDNDYVDFIKDMNPDTKKLVVDIYNENKSSFDQIGNTVKAEIFNAIFYGAASISKPELYGGTEAKERLSKIISSGIAIKMGGKLSKLISFFREHAEEYDRIAQNDLEKLRKQMARVEQNHKRVEQNHKRVEQNHKRVEQYSAKVDKYSAKVDKYSAKVDKLTELVSQLDGLLN